MTPFEIYFGNLMNQAIADASLGSGSGLAGAFGQAAQQNLLAKQFLDQLNLQRLTQYDLPKYQTDAQTQLALELARLRAKERANMLAGAATQLPVLLGMLGSLGAGPGIQGWDIRDAQGNITSSVRLPIGGGGGGGVGAFGGMPNMATRRWLRAFSHPGATWDKQLGWQFRPWGVPPTRRRQYL
jgi:hypothetical protein